MRHSIKKENSNKLDLKRCECLFPSIAEEILFDINPEANDLIKYHSAYDIEKTLSEKVKGYVFCNNGSENTIKQIIECLYKECNEWVIPSPTFELAHFYCEHYGCVIHAPKYEFANLHNTFFLDLNKSKGNPKNQILYIVSPHNPTGIILSYEEINELCENYKYVIIDEAYLKPDNEPLIQRDNLILIRTFSKMGGITGLRFGYGICFNKNLYNKFIQIRPNYMNSFTLKCVNYILNNFITHKVEKKINDFIKKLPEKNIYAQAGNFVTLKNIKTFEGYDLKHYKISNNDFYRITAYEQD